MKDENTNPYSAHSEIMLLLPWYVNKTLHDQEKKAVENHIKVCLTCKREIAALETLSLAVNQTNMMDVAAQASFSRLKTRIYQAGNGSIKAAPEKTDRSGRFDWSRIFSFTFLTLPQPALGLLAIVILLIPAYLIFGKAWENNYRALSSSENLSVKDNEIRVIFLESTSTLQKEAVIQSINGEIVNGPNAQGVYLIRLKQASDAKYILATVASLRKNSSIIFAEPSYALLSSQSGEAPK